MLSSITQLSQSQVMKEYFKSDIYLVNNDPSHVNANNNQITVVHLTYATTFPKSMNIFNYPRWIIKFIKLHHLYLAIDLRCRYSDYKPISFWQGGSTTPD